MSNRKEYIFQTVLNVTQKVAGKTKSPITLKSKFIKDLKLLSDDATEICLLVQEDTGIKPPLKEWRNVFTLEDMVELLVKYDTCI